MFNLEQFVAESNRIEGIVRKPYAHEIEAHEAVLSAPLITIPLLSQFVMTVAPGNRLRSKVGLDVRVGNYYPPPGGPDIVLMLTTILTLRGGSAYQQHMAYESLHPFTDGNGRSGRVLWLRAMGGIERVPLGFLHTWYYQSLNAQQSNHQ